MKNIFISVTYALSLQLIDNVNAIDEIDEHEFYKDNNISYKRDANFILQEYQNGSFATESRTLNLPKNTTNNQLHLQDGRKRIENTTEWPYTFHAHLKLDFNGSIYQGSGSIVGPHHLLTCAHNVYGYELGGYATNILVIPALNNNDKDGLDTKPFGKIRVVKSYIYKSWKDIKDSKFDIALLLLSETIGDRTGWGRLLSATTTELSNKKVDITGYPGDKLNILRQSGRQMWGMTDRISQVSDEQFEYEIDTHAGQSGSPVKIDESSIVGVHTRGYNVGSRHIIDLRVNKDTNELSKLFQSGVRITEKKIKDFSVIIQNSYTLTFNNSPSNIILASNQPSLMSSVLVPNNATFSIQQSNSGTTELYIVQVAAVTGMAGMILKKLGSSSVSKTLGKGLLVVSGATVLVSLGSLLVKKLYADYYYKESAEH